MSRERPAQTSSRRSGALRALSAFALAVILSPAAAQAQPRPTLSIGRISSEKTCTLYQESAGRSALVATPFTLAVASSWQTWLVRDCVNNFASIRTSLQAALASSGKFALVGAGGTYTVLGAMSQAGGDPGPAPGAPTSPDGYSVSSRHIFASFEVTLRDRAGHIVYGGLVTKRLETGSDIQTPGLHTTSSESGEAVYTELQNQVALAIARVVAFHVVPLQVVGLNGREIQLNYGSPLLTAGTMVQATSRDGASRVRFTVTSADAEGATAELYGEGDMSTLEPGVVATVIEPEDSAANARRYKRVDLPE